jgi:hypothetical protein
MNHQQVKIQKSLKVKTNRKNDERNQSTRKSGKRKITKSKSNRKKKSKKSKKSKKRKFKNSDGTRDPHIERYSTRLKKILENKTYTVDDIYKILNDITEYYERNVFLSDDIHFFFNTISWSIPSEQNINDIVKFTRINECPYILEIGSGLGLWASILRKNNIKVHATDDFSWYKDKEKMFYTEIENINYQDALKKYNDENACLLLCWPPKDDDLAKYCLQNFNGKYLIYIGQGKGGLNGNLEFFTMLESGSVNRCYELVKEIEEPFSDEEEDEEEKYAKTTHIFNDYTNITTDKILFYRITDVGKFILGMIKRENLDNLESITFHQKFGKNLEEKITYTNSEYKFKFVITKQRLQIIDKKTDSLKIVYFPSDACAYKFENEEITELK